MTKLIQPPDALTLAAWQAEQTEDAHPVLLLLDHRVQAWGEDLAVIAARERNNPKKHTSEEYQVMLRDQHPEQISPNPEYVAWWPQEPDVSAHFPAIKTDRRTAAKWFADRSTPNV